MPNDDPAFDAAGARAYLPRAYAGLHRRAAVAQPYRGCQDSLQQPTGSRNEGPTRTYGHRDRPQTGHVNKPLEARPEPYGSSGMDRPGCMPVRGEETMSEPTESGLETFVWKGKTRYKCPWRFDSGVMCEYDTYDPKLVMDHVKDTHGLPTARAGRGSRILDQHGNNFEIPDPAPELRGVHFKKEE